MNAPLHRLLQIGLAFSVGSVISVIGQTDKPERTVDENVITSTRDPEVQVHLPPAASYIGADRWILFGIADCELHAFVKADPQRNVQRLYWIQFEQYLPSKPELHHQYNSPRHTIIGGMDFYVDTWISTADQKPKPGSDSEHIRGLIAHAGYTMPAATMGVRLVHLLDEAKRKELMIIYVEDLAPTGFTPGDLGQDGKAHDRWPMIEEELIERAKNAIVISRYAPL